MRPNTHLAIDGTLCGQPVRLSEGAATVRLTTLQQMSADDRGLVHGGFLFGLADYAVMLAVNHPHVVLGAADTRFTAPVRVGEVVTAEAVRTENAGRKHIVEVHAAVGDREVLRGTFTAFVLDKHVLD
jgi:acyl-coenzyme A thioesterase PaaI-like protein